MKYKKLGLIKSTILTFFVLTFCFTNLNSKDRLILKLKNGPQEVIDMDKLNTIKFINITSIEEININNDNDKNIFIYPNPTKDKLLIKLEKIENIKSKFVEVSIYNSNSQIIKSLKFNTSDEIEINLVDLNLNKGVYFININDNNQLIKKSKFILE